MTPLERSFTIWKLIGAAVLIAILALLFLNSSLHQNERPTQNDPANLAVGPADPGDTELVNALKEKGLIAEGKATYVNFWAYWCQPCRVEMPMLDELQAEFSDQLQIVLLNLDNEGTLLKQAKNFAKSNISNARVVFDVQGLNIASLGIDRLPAHLLTDSQGNVVNLFFGSVVGKEDQVKEWIHQALDLTK